MGGSLDVIVSSVSKIAPILGGVLGTPLAGVAVGLLAKCFGVDVSNLSDLAHKIATDPDSAVKIKQLENEHVETLQKIITQNYAIEVDDRKDARKTGILYTDFLRHMAYVVTLGFFLALGFLFIPIEINPNARELLSMLVGMLASKWQTIIDFFYGSTHAQNKRFKEK